MLTINTMERQIIETNTTSDNISFLVDNKFFCVNIENFTHLQLEKGNVFQKQYIKILKNNPTIIT